MANFKIQPMISYWANCFFFISNLSEWHWSTRKFYNSYWLSRTGKLTSTESEALTKAKAIFAKYGFGDRYWGLVFLREPEEEVWDKAKRFFEPQELKSLEEIYEVFKHRFEAIWKTDRENLLAWRDRFNDIRDKLCPDALLSDLDALFFGTERKRKHKSVKVVFLISFPNKFAGGGGNLGPGVVTLELSQTPLEYVRPVVLAMWHEIAHSLWMINGYEDMVEKFVKEKDEMLNFDDSPSLRVFVNEAVAESLLPYGYLAQKHFNFPSDEYFSKQEKIVLRKENNVLEKWRLYSASRLMPLARKYVEEGKVLDSAFLDKVYELFVEARDLIGIGQLKGRN